MIKPSDGLRSPRRSLFYLVTCAEDLDFARSMAARSAVRCQDINLVITEDGGGLQTRPPPGIDRVCVAPFANDAPQLSVSDLTGGAGSYIGFAAGASWPLTPEPAILGNDDVDWVVTDSWMCREAMVPVRRERSRQSECQYGTHRIENLSSMAALLDDCGDPAWLIGLEPVSWFRKDWLLEGADGNARQTPIGLIHGRLKRALATGDTVWIHFSPISGAARTLPSALPGSALIRHCQNESQRWTDLLQAYSNESSDLRRSLLPLLARTRPWLFSPQPPSASWLAEIVRQFRSQWPDAPALRHRLSEGRRWAVVRDPQIDDVQVLSKPAAATWGNRKIEPSEMIAIRCELVRMDQLCGVNAYDVTWRDSEGKFWQLMALYVQCDGRWALPSILADWPVDTLDALADTLDLSVSKAPKSQMTFFDAALAESLKAFGRGRFVPGFEAYSTLVQHTARYRWVGRQGSLGRVLDCASGAGYGFHILTDSKGLASYTGIDADAEAIGFAKQFVPTSAADQCFRATRLDALPKGAFDTVISFETLEHVDDPEVFLWDLAARIAPGGRLFLSVPAETWAGSHLNPAHLTNWTEARLRRLCARVFEATAVYRLRLSLICPETFQSALIHTGIADPTEDEGFIILLERPRPRILSRRLIVNRRGAVGDAILVTSVLGNLRRRFPDRQLVVRTQFVEAFLGLDEVDLLGCMSIAIRSDDLVIDLDQSYERLREAHIIVAYAETAGVGAEEPRLARSSRDYRLIAGKLTSIPGFVESPVPRLVAVHMAATSPDRQWPTAHWGHLLKRLMTQDVVLVLVGGGRDLDAEVLPDAWRERVVSVVRQARLAETAAAIALADLLVAPDSGLIHVAHAVGTPVIGLFGMAEPAQRLPLRGSSVGIMAQIECRGCIRDIPADAPPRCRRGHAYCMDELKVDPVWLATQTLLETLIPYRWQQRLLASVPLPMSSMPFAAIQNRSAI